MKLLRTLLATLVAAMTSNAAELTPEKNPAEMMRQLRIGWLKTIPEKGSYKTEADVVAVVMDWPMGEQTITVLAAAAGDASLYTTSTFGVIGGIGHEKVRNAAMAFVARAKNHLALTQPTSDFSYPDSKTLRFFMVTPSGVRVVSFPMTETEKVNSPAWSLFSAAQQVVTQLRLTVSQQK